MMYFSRKIETIELKKITASEGKVLTNGEVYSEEVYLGKFDSPENWHEVTAEEYNKVLEAQALEVENGGYN